MMAEPNVAELREKFLSKYSGNILDDTYHDDDVTRVKKQDAFLKCVLNCLHVKGDINKGMEMLDEILMYRSKNKLNDLKETDLNEELRGKNGIYYKGKDKKGNPIMQIKVARSKRGHLVKEGQLMIAYYMFQHYKDHPDVPVVLLFDFTDAGVSNMDLDVTKFIVQCTSRLFPGLLAYSLMFKMGVALEALWKIIKGWLDAEQSKKTYFVKRSNIQEYIDQSELEPHMIKDDSKK